MTKGGLPGMMGSGAITEDTGGSASVSPMSGISSNCLLHCHLERSSVGQPSNIVWRFR